MTDHVDWEREVTEVPVTAYTFSPSLGTVTFTNLTVVDPHRVKAIYDTSIQPDPNAHFELGTVLYLATQASQASVSGNVLYLPGGVVPQNASAADQLHITYDITPPEGLNLIQLPNKAAFPTAGAPNFLYFAKDTGQLWEYDGTAYVAV